MALVPTPGMGLLAEPRYLQVTMPLPSVLVDNSVCGTGGQPRIPGACTGRGVAAHVYRHAHAQPVSGCFRCGVACCLLGNQLARPLLVLAEGVREVAQGNLSPKAALQVRTNWGLTRSFALMTQQLADARAAVEKSMGRWMLRVRDCRPFWTT